jgi:hypothetical protein
MTTRRMVLAAFGLAPFVLARPTPVSAATPEIYAEDGIAIDGTDAVAYFSEGRPREGLPAHELQWRGAVWRFSSDANRALFAANPEAYAPQYGGWCAWAVAEGYTASTVPDAWRIVNDRLYLNFSRGVQRRWERDIPGNIARADANWPDVLAG